MLFNILLLIFFIILSAFFSASETAIFSLGSVRLHRLKEKYPRAKTIESLLKRPGRLLSAIVFGNMLVNIGLASLSAAICANLWGRRGIVLAIISSGVLILYLGEIFPKTMAIYLAEKISLVSSPLLAVFSKVFSPIIVTMDKTVGWFLSFFIRRYKAKVAFSDEELKTALLLGRREGQITAAEEEMISHVLEFKDTWVSEILTARIDIQGIDSELSQEEVLKISREKKHSKFPVYDNSLDNVIGILYAKDVFLNPTKDYRRLLREAIFVPESKKIDDLLKIFSEKNQRIAIILDEYGGTQGLVTLEDIQEEIFGEIYDEFEVPSELIEKIDQDKWRLHGKVPIKNLNLELDLSLPEDQDTLAGFLLSSMERIPKQDEIFKFQNLVFSVEKATKKRIVSVILKKE